MLKIGKNELICDFAETYQIYNLRSLPLNVVATLACGLRDNSRIKMKIMSTKIDLNTMLMASIVDRLNLLIWSKTKDGAENRNRPDSLVEILQGKEPKQKTKNYKSYSTGEEFRSAWNKIQEGLNGN